MCGGAVRLHSGGEKVNGVWMSVRELVSKAEGGLKREARREGKHAGPAHTGPALAGPGLLVVAVAVHERKAELALLRRLRHS